MRKSVLGLVTVASLLTTTAAFADSVDAPRPYCAPEVNELATEHNQVCYFDGAASETEHHTLLVYLHGALPARPGVAYLQQRAMAWHAKQNGVTVLMPEAPEAEGFCVWPRSREAQAAQETQIVANIKDAKNKLENELGVVFDETYVVGFSSGAYYASSLAMRGVLDVDGYVILAGGSPQPNEVDANETRIPVFVGVAGGDKTTASGARSLGGELRDLGWPSRVEEQGTGHLVDGILLAHGLGWLRANAADRAMNAAMHREN